MRQFKKWKNENIKLMDAEQLGRAVAEFHGRLSEKKGPNYSVYPVPKGASMLAADLVARFGIKIASDAVAADWVIDNTVSSGRTFISIGAPPEKCACLFGLANTKRKFEPAVVAFRLQTVVEIYGYGGDRGGDESARGIRELWQLKRTFTTIERDLPPDTYERARAIREGRPLPAPVTAAPLPPAISPQAAPPPKRFTLEYVQAQVKICQGCEFNGGLSRRPVDTTEEDIVVCKSCGTCGGSQSLVLSRQACPRGNRPPLTAQ